MWYTVSGSCDFSTLSVSPLAMIHKGSYVFAADIVANAVIESFVFPWTIVWILSEPVSAHVRSPFGNTFYEVSSQFAMWSHWIFELNKSCICFSHTVIISGVDAERRSNRVLREEKWFRFLKFAIKWGPISTFCIASMSYSSLSSSVNSFAG